ncbi:arabinose-5-phosphate isomerase [Pseudooceanicola antarcticus]|uniref:Arabinose-5-phosphate isomerase n=1 Tax=Pseudooceanicola antarcticus TaxID=1247613 RepID=A0A285IH61_9RHOB|nr:KpsF/GutQ family sugar-phosphate isomerase [Pseudooceanicola antarcticus]PJE28990.1 KpsF/GutQ family sugar-phosphate isomerase [Pseudooceanicola antarcticus]SNY47340.1 arabinose-5-phosphate isomerase [Pseudooceanicola antarcticus]
MSSLAPHNELPNDPMLETARRVLRTEADALAHLAEHLPEDFAPAIRKILGSKGRVIVSGMGKSGHIGRKIAATLASTGTPSHFVHPGEASHGDLGMITPEDICLLISNSGETSELRDILYHSQRFSIPVIGISSRAGSTLMQAADFRLTLPDLPEACSIGMAPTTSTTLTLAIGDALAVALMEERRFLPEDFRIYHPGGKLGAQMTRIADLMHGGEELPCLPADSSMSDVLLTMTSHGFGIAGLTEGGKLAGVITDGDLRRNMEGLMSRAAMDVATRNPLTAPPEMLAPEALALLNSRKLNVLLVVDADGVPQGVLHIHDLLRAGVM